MIEICFVMIALLIPSIAIVFFIVCATKYNSDNANPEKKWIYKVGMIVSLVVLAVVILVAVAYHILVSMVVAHM